MTITRKKTESLIRELNDAENWDNSKLDQSAESCLHRMMDTPIRPIHRGLGCLGYYVDLRKELDPDYKEVIIFFVQIREPDRPALDGIMNDMRNVMLKEGLNHQPYFLFVFNAAGMSENSIKEQFWDGIVYDRNKFKAWAIQPNLIRKTIIERLKRHRNKKPRNPFHHLGPCKPDMFVGRDKEIENILTGSQIGYAITGGRRIGKTSLLLKLQDEAKKGRQSDDMFKALRPLFIDCSTFTSYQQLIDEITRKLFPEYHYKKSFKSAVAKYNLTFDHILARAKGLSGKSTLLLLDEMDTLVAKAKEENEDTLDFFGPLRSESNKRSVKLVIAGFLEVSEMVRDSSHPLYNLCEKIFLGGLNEDEVGNLIMRSFARIGVFLSDEKKIVKRIYDITAGHPSVVQFIAMQLYKSIKGNKITNKGLDDIIRNRELISFILDNYIMNTSPLERLIGLLTLEHDSFDMQMILKALDYEKVYMKDSTQAVHIALENMVANNILVSDGRKYRFLYPLMKSIIRENFLSPFVIQTLKREVSQWL